LFFLAMCSWLLGIIRLNCKPERAAVAANCLRNRCRTDCLQFLTSPWLVYRTAPLTHQAAAVYVNETRSLLRALWLAEAACGVMAPLAYFRVTNCSVRLSLHLGEQASWHSSLLSSAVSDDTGASCSAVLAGVDGAGVLRSIYAALLVGALVLTMFVAIFSWGGTVASLAVMRRQEQQQQADTLLRWLSHECRSPVQAAMLQLTNVQDEHADDFRLLQQRHRSMPNAEAADQLSAEDSEQLPEKLLAINTTLKSLGDILDNMLAFMRQRHTHAQATTNDRQVLCKLNVPSIWKTAWQNAAAVSAVDSRDSRCNITVSAQQLQLQGPSPETALAPQSHVVSQEVGMGPCPASPMSELQSWALSSTVSSSTMQQVLTNLVSNALKYGQRRSQDGTGQQTDIKVSFSLHRYMCPFSEAPLHLPSGTPSPARAENDGLYAGVMAVVMASGISAEEDDGLGDGEQSPDQMFRGVLGAYHTQDENGVPFVLPIMSGRSSSLSHTQQQTLPQARAQSSSAVAGHALSMQQTARRAVRMAKRHAVQQVASWTTERTISHDDEGDVASNSGVALKKQPLSNTQPVPIQRKIEVLIDNLGPRGGGPAGAPGDETMLPSTGSAHSHDKPTSPAVNTSRSEHAVAGGTGIQMPFSGTVDVDDLVCPAVLAVTVSDSGEGMTWADAKTLFQPFRRLRHGGQQASKGTGLGLWLMKELVVPQGGALEVVQAARKAGCTFRLLLPAILEPSPQQPMPQCQPTMEHTAPLLHVQLASPAVEGGGGMLHAQHTHPATGAGTADMLTTGTALPGLHLRKYTPLQQHSELLAPPPWRQQQSR